MQTGTASKIAIAEEITTGIGNKFSVYPNPARNFANLAFNAGVAGNAKVLVINQTGSEVIRKTIPVNEGPIPPRWISTISNGVYFVQDSNRLACSNGETGDRTIMIYRIYTEEAA